MNDLELCYEQCYKNKLLLKKLGLDLKARNEYYYRCRHDCREKGVPRIVLWSDYYVYG